MEENKAITTSAEHVELPSMLRPRHVPDVPEDVDFLMEHLNDPNFDLKAPRHRSSYSSSGHRTQIKKKRFSYDASELDSESQFEYDRRSTSRAESRNSELIEFDDESPYPEVRSAVSSIDDPLMPVNTFRMWFLGVLTTIFVSGMNQVFSIRYPSIFISGIVVTVLSLPLGRLLAKILPTTRFNTFGYIWSFNPGPFSVKEHVCISVMGNLVVFGAYASDVPFTQQVYYKQNPKFSFKILLLLSTQVLGFSLAGFLRRYAVWPAAMIWPGSLVNCALFNALHNSSGKLERNHMSRVRFFTIILAGSFVWYWVPGYLFTALSFFNWVCWIAPNNLTLNTLFGVSSGLGMSVLTFDWAMVSYIGSPLVTPWWSQMNTGIAFVLFAWVLAPIMYFTNTFNAAYFPITSFVSFDNTGNPYDGKSIITDGIFDQAKYEAYSPIFMPTMLALAYGVSFATIPAVLVHTCLWFRKDIVRRFKRSLKDEQDVHSRLMQAYPEVPIWWYLIVGVIALVLLLVSIEIGDTKLPIWAALIACLTSAILSLPLATLQAITNQQIPTQVFHELVAGYMIPGRPIANIVYKAIGSNVGDQAVAFTGYLKLGHYMKIPPRIMFAVQTVSSVIACFVAILVQDWLLANVEDICSPDQKDGFVCPGSTVFASVSVIWGGIGPQRMFSPGAPYSSLLWFFLIGAALPIPCYFLARRFPLSLWRYANIPVFFAGLAALGTATGMNFISWVLVGFIFNFVIRRFHLRWWMRYNYILSAGLDAGVALAAIAIFFVLQFSKNGGSLDWWGNSVWVNTADGQGLGIRSIPPGTTIGPTTWS